MDVTNAYGNDPAKEKEHGWKVYGARLGESLAALEADVTKAKGLPKPAVDYVVKGVVQQGRDLAKKMEGKLAANPANFSGWLGSAEGTPPSDQVYKGMADSVVKFPGSGN